MRRQVVLEKAVDQAPGAEQARELLARHLPTAVARQRVLAGDGAIAGRADLAGDLARQRLAHRGEHLGRARRRQLRQHAAQRLGGLLRGPGQGPGDIAGRRQRLALGRIVDRRQVRCQLAQQRLQLVDGRRRPGRVALKRIEARPQRLDRDFAHRRAQQRQQRRIGAGQRLCQLGAGRQRRRRRQAQIAEVVRPVFGVVGQQQALDFADQCLLRGRIGGAGGRGTEDPALLLCELAQHLQRALRQHLQEHGARIQRRNASAQRLAAGAHEDPPRRRARGRLGAEWHRAGAQVGLLEALVGALRRRDAGHQAACAGDQLRVGVGGGTDFAAGQQAVEVAPQRFALFGADTARQRRLPIDDQVGAQRRAIEVPAAEQHQVGLERVVDQLDMLTFADAQAVL